MNSFAIRCLCLAALAAGAAALCRLAPELGPGGGPGVVMTLPPRVGGFVSETREPEPLEKSLLPADTEFAKAVYWSSPADRTRRDIIHVEVILSGAERRSIHRPEVCLQGQGWTLTDSRLRRLPMGGGRELEVRDLSIEKQIILKDGARRPLRAHYFYWFVGQDATTASHAGRIWLTMRDSISRGVNHRWACAGALARVTDGFSTGETGERPRDDGDTVRLLENFVRILAPQFQKSFMDSPPMTAAN